MKIDTHIVPVVGVSFVDSYPGNLEALCEVWDGLSWEDEPLTVILRRNPDNEYDANAVEVHVPSIGMIGHCSRIIAARLAPSMDAGIEFRASVHGIRVDPDHPEQPGIDIAFKRVEREEPA